MGQRLTSACEITHSDHTRLSRADSLQQGVGQSRDWIWRRSLNILCLALGCVSVCSHRVSCMCSEGETHRSVGQWRTLWDWRDIFLCLTPPCETTWTTASAGQRQGGNINQMSHKKRLVGTSFMSVLHCYVHECIFVYLDALNTVNCGSPQTL